MIRLLSAIGRVVIAVAAVLTVISCTMVGYLFARSQEFAIYGNFSISGSGQITPLEVFYSVLGGGIGFVVSGAVFGAIATLYEIRDSLRLITSHLRLITSQKTDNPLPSELAGQRVARRVRREPHVG